MSSDSFCNRSPPVKRLKLETASIDFVVIYTEPSKSSPLSSLTSKQDACYTEIAVQAVWARPVGDLLRLCPGFVAHIPRQLRFY